MRALSTLPREESGATIVEFGLLLPVIFGGFLSVLQVGIGMMAYNGLRNATAEASRYALVEYQNSREMGDWGAIEDQATIVARRGGLDPARLDIDAVSGAEVDVAGAIEVTITATYQVQSVLPFLGINDFTVTYERPLYLIDETP